MRALPVTLLVVLGLLLGTASARRPPRPRIGPGEAAARAFDRGQQLYLEGRYPDAITAFGEAQRLAPHPSALFNIGRCHENLGNVGQAIESYEEALRLTEDEAERRDLRKRLARLRASPVKVFISSQPSGARVTVDGRAQPEPQPTPMLVRLKPGEHVLLVNRPGFQLATRRIAVEVEKEQPVEVTLLPVPPPCPPPPPPCPPPTVCPSCRLVEFDRLHLHLAVMGTFAVTQNRPFTGGPSFYLLASYRRWIFGANIAFLPFDEVSKDLLIATGGVTSKFTKLRPRWILGQVELGRVFPFKSFFAFATAGLGISADRNVFLGTEEVSQKETSAVSEQFAFAWSLGGGIEAMATSWLSFGLAARFGLIHGKRADRESAASDAAESGRNFPYGLISGVVSFHL